MSSVEEATRCVNELNGLVRVEIFEVQPLPYLVNIGFEREANSSRLFDD